MEIERTRRLRYGLQAVLMTAAVIFSVILIFILMDRKPLRWDLTQNKEHSLSDQTKKVLKAGDKCRARIVAISYKDMQNPRV